MRLIDMVRTGQFNIHPDVQGTLRRMGLNITSLANEAVPVEITNVVDWVTSDWWPSARGNVKLGEYFSGIRPSFPVLWFEWNKGQLGKRAACCVVDDVGDWIVLLIDQVLNIGGQTPWLSHAGVVQLPDETGAVAFTYDANEPDGEESSKFLIGNGCVMALMAQTLMHCKNVSVVKTPKQPKLAKKFTRKHGVPPSQFRTIVIDPMKAAVRSARCTGATEAAAKQRMHVIRGHFKTYTSERRLFGKVSGRFFFSAHVAGDPAIGVIHSDYVVKAGNVSQAAHPTDSPGMQGAI